MTRETQRTGRERGVLATHTARTACTARMRRGGAGWAWAPWCVSALALMVAGCGVGATGAAAGGAASGTTRAPAAKVSSAQGSQADRYVPPVILRNPAPGALEISLSVTIEQQPGEAQPMTEVGLGFSSGGQIVQFAGDERVTCNGVDLALKNRAAVFQVLRAPTAKVAGTAVRCEYAAGGAVAGVTLQIPAGPAITSPRADAPVARSVRTVVSYRSDAATDTLLGVVALADTSPPSKAVGRLNTPGPSQATVDTSGFAAGTGALVLTADLTPRVTVTGVAFKSVRAFGTASVWVPVIWS